MKRWRKALSLLVILGVMGVFFVPSILNYQLPHAQTQELKTRKIVRTIMIDAHLQPMDILRFSFDQPVVVSEYFVKKGRNVGRNIPLFQLSKEMGIPQNVNEQASSWKRREREIILEMDRLIAAEEVLKIELNQLAQELEKKTSQVKEKEALFALGLVSEQELIAARSERESQWQSIKIAEEEQELNEESRSARMEALQNEWDQIRNELEIVDTLVAGFYLDEEGKAYSQQSGFILNKNAENERIPSNQSVLELAMIDDFQRLEMIGLVAVEDLEYMHLGMQLQIDTDTENRPFHLEITDISRLVEEGLVEVTMELVEEPEGKFAIGTTYTGRIETVLTEENTYAIPFSAIVEEDFHEDEMVSIYYLEKAEGRLYNQYVVRQLRVKTKAIGDREVLVQIESNQVNLDTVVIITNPGYKIYQGARVLP